LPWPQVWPKRQEVPQQWVLTEYASMEDIERTNAVMVHPTQRAGLVQYNTYTIEVDRGRNCYSCGKFGHLAQNCRR